MDPNEKTDLVDLIADAVDATPDEPVTDVAEAVEQEVTGTTEEVAEVTETTEVAEEVETPPEPVETLVEPEPEKSEHDKAVDKEIAELGLKEKSSARFRELANRARERDEFESRYNEQAKVFDHMEKAGISGEQFGVMTAIAADVNSGDPVREERAYKALMAEAGALAQKLGYRTEGHNPLSAHPDLAKRVEDGLLDENDALELARARQMQTRQTEFREKRGTEDAKAEELRSVKASLNVLERDLSADPLYSAKRAIAEPMLKRMIARGLPPSDWVDTYRELVESARVSAPAPKPAAVVKPAPDNRARPNGAAGKPVSTNTADLIAQGLGLSAE